LAESCFSSLGRDAIGADVNLEGELTPTTHLFSESPSRIVISFQSTDADAVRVIAEHNNAPLKILGRVGGHRLIINVNGAEAVATDVSDLEAAWRNALSGKLQAEVVSA
jgi:phosphoribosylformylglycinamidine synthase